MKDIFLDWRFDDEPARSEYQLVIPRKNPNGKYEYIGSIGQFVNIVYKDDTENEAEVDKNAIACSYLDFGRPKYFLPHYFEKWYNHAELVDIEYFLNYQLQVHQDNALACLKFLRALIQGMRHINEWELNFEGKRQIGLTWVAENMPKGQGKNSSLSGHFSKEIRKHTFDSIWTVPELKDKILVLLKIEGIIDKNNNWIGLTNNNNEITSLYQVLRKKGYFLIDDQTMLGRIFYDFFNISVRNERNYRLEPSSIRKYKKIIPEANVLKNYHTK